MTSTPEQRGWYWYDWANSVFTTSVTTVFLGPYLTDVAERAAGGEDGTLHPLGIPVSPGSVFPYLLSLSALSPEWRTRWTSTRGARVRRAGSGRG